MPAFLAARAVLMRVAASLIALPPGNAGTVTRATITAINPDGFSAVDSAPPSVNFTPNATPEYVVLNRQGFDNSGAPKSYAENAVVTTRMRLPFQNTAPFNTTTSQHYYTNAEVMTNGLIDPTKEALSTLVYSTDAIVGGSTAANNSTVTSPKPIAQFQQPDQQVLRAGTDSLRIDVVAGHRNARNGEPVAAVVVSATDGTNTVSKTVSTSSVLPAAAGMPSIVGYSAIFSAFDLAALGNGQITVNAKIFPWIGTSASVLDSTGATQGARASNPLALVPQIFWKTATPVYYVYVANTASGCAASQNAATALGTPCADVATALTALNTAGAGLSGQHVRIMSGTQVFGTLSSTNYTNAATGEVVIEGDPAASAGSAILSVAANLTVKVPALRIQNLTLARTTTAQIATLGVLTLDTVTYQNSGNAAMVTAVTALRLVNVAVTGWQQNLLLADVRLARGLSGAAGTGIIPAANLNGSSLTGGVYQTASYLDGNSVNTSNRFLSQTANGLVVASSTTLADTITGYYFAQNVVEYISATTNPVFRPSGDGATESTDHFVFFNNTFAGCSNFGRSNILYNEANASTGARTQSRVASKGNIWVEVNTKHDVFLGTDGNGSPQTGYAGQRTGGWQFMYGVDVQGEMVQFADAGGAQAGTGGYFGQAFAGLGTKSGTGTSSATIFDPKFVSPQATTCTSPTSATAGAGGGDYRIASTSPAIGLVSNPVLKFFQDGTPRSAANDNAGALAMAQ